MFDVIIKLKFIFKAIFNPIKFISNLVLLINFTSHAIEIFNLNFIFKLKSFLISLLIIFNAYLFETYLWNQRNSFRFLFKVYLPFQILTLS